MAKYNLFNCIAISESILSRFHDQNFDCPKIRNIALSYNINKNIFKRFAI